MGEGTRAAIWQSCPGNWEKLNQERSKGWSSPRACPGPEAPLVQELIVKGCEAALKKKKKSFNTINFLNSFFTSLSNISIKIVQN